MSPELTWLAPRWPFLCPAFWRRAVFRVLIDLAAATRLMDVVGLLVLISGERPAVESPCCGASQADPPFAVCVALMLDVARTEPSLALQATQQPNHPARAHQLRRKKRLHNSVRLLNPSREVVYVVPRGPDDNTEVIGSLAVDTDTVTAAEAVSGPDDCGVVEFMDGEDQVVNLGDIGVTARRTIVGEGDRVLVPTTEFGDPTGLSVKTLPEVEHLVKGRQAGDECTSDDIPRREVGFG